MFQLGQRPRIMSQLCRQTYMAKERLSFTSLPAIGQLTHLFEDVKNMAETSKIHGKMHRILFQQTLSAAITILIFAIAASK